MPLTPNSKINNKSDMFVNFIIANISFPFQICRRLQQPLTNIGVPGSRKISVSHFTTTGFPKMIL